MTRAKRTSSHRVLERPFRVDCPRFDGTMRLYAAYSTREQAEAAASQLRAVGCHVIVRGPDDPASAVAQ